MHLHMPIRIYIQTLYTYIYTYIYICTYIQTHMHKHIYMHKHIHAYTYVCGHIHTHTYTHMLQTTPLSKLFFFFVCLFVCLFLSNLFRYRRIVSNNCTDGLRDKYSAKTQLCPGKAPRGLHVVTTDGRLVAEQGHNATFIILMEEVGDHLGVCSQNRMLTVP
jgi:hypothetical protein